MGWGTPFLAGLFCVAVLLTVPSACTVMSSVSLLSAVSLAPLFPSALQYTAPRALISNVFLPVLRTCVQSHVFTSRILASFTPPDKCSEYTFALSRENACEYLSASLPASPPSPSFLEAFLVSSAIWNQYHANGLPDCYDY